MHRTPLQLLLGSSLFQGSPVAGQPSTATPLVKVAWNARSSSPSVLAVALVWIRSASVASASMADRRGGAIAGRW